MRVVGIVGGIGSGKSHLVKTASLLGACSINADRLAHEIIVYPEIVDQLQARWGRLEHISQNVEHGIDIKGNWRFVSRSGPNVINPERLREEVANIVFKNPHELEFLESIMFPLIDKRLREAIDRYHPVHTKTLLIDAPLLYEAKWHRLCEAVAFVDAPLETRVSRVANRMDGKKLTREELLAREGRQMSLDEKLQRADYVVKNYGTEQEFDEEIRMFYLFCVGGNT